MGSKKSDYLKDARLGEVLSLIQVLAYHKYTSRSEEGLGEDLQRKPESAKSWVVLATSHPELFRVRQKVDKKMLVALVSRYALPPKTLASGEESRPVLEPGIVNKLMDMAIELHDRQVNQKYRWQVVGPAIITASAAITAAVIRWILA
ncbi:hypothetical protein [Microbulbifer sp. ZKSA002]|uniref:hypothetical protein n=1 Tax=Microbulbifer sp. ZKSA002 TaxID=3243388 RepID=UPI0040393A86